MQQVHLDYNVLAYANRSQSIKQFLSYGKFSLKNTKAALKVKGQGGQMSPEPNHF